MKDQVDKGILRIDYNVLSLPDNVVFDKTYSPRVITEDVEINVNTKYLYRADGTKLRKTYTFGLGRTNLETKTITEYLNGFQYEARDTGTAFSQVLKFVPTAEGYYNFENNKYIYNYTDHLGNVRLSYAKSSTGSAEVIEESNYYPFGLKHTISLNGNLAYNYGYNGKDLQKETGWSDYGARMYMSDIGRWGVIDPLAETSRRFSPYNYVVNNPISFIDPDGRKFAMPYEQGDMASQDPNSGWWMGMTGERTHISPFKNYGGGDVYDQKPATFGETQEFRDIMAYLAQPDYFAGINFEQFGNGDPTPKRKYLKNESSFNIWGIETKKIQYQLDNVNMNLEFKQITKQIKELTSKVDKVMDWTPGIGGIKGAYDFIKEGVKVLNPQSLTFVLGATTILLENANAENFLEMYEDVRSNYTDIHAAFPANQKGITVNLDMVVGPQNHIWSRYSFYDISTHRYLGGRTFE
nr:RHS repeat-associated core domain-containing protein [Chryseobacterium sp. ISL-6]